MKDKFTDAEWELVKSVPFQAFMLIAKADGAVDEAELNEFVHRISTGALGYKDPLHREVAQFVLQSGASAILDGIQKALAIDPGKIRDMLADKLTPSEYQSYMGSILLDAMAYAKASGSKASFFSKKKMVSEEEEKAIKVWALFWKVDLQALTTTFG